MRSKTVDAVAEHLEIHISIHLLRAEQDGTAGAGHKPAPAYFNPLAPCGARQPWQQCGSLTRTISIHLLRAEQDAHGEHISECGNNFNPLAPCGARLRRMLDTREIDIISIHLLRAEQDRAQRADGEAHVDFNPLAPCGARHFSSMGLFGMEGKMISIHLLRVEQDTIKRGSRGDDVISIHLLRVEQDVGKGQLVARSVISIHLLRVEQDARILPASAACGYFNPLAPCGARLIMYTQTTKGRKFQSTCSVWSKTHPNR